jgi:hypothetical protein
MEENSRDAAQSAVVPAAIPVATIQAQQNFGLAVAAGLGAALGGAIVWAIFCVLTKMELGLAAVAVGYGVGQAIRVTGKGIDQKFGVLGAICAFIGCLLGNFLTAVALFAQARGFSFFQVLGSFDFELYQRLMTVFFQPMDLLFYAIAIYEGYRFSIRYKVRA